MPKPTSAAGQEANALVAASARRTYGSAPHNPRAADLLANPSPLHVVKHQITQESPAATVAALGRRARYGLLPEWGELAVVPASRHQGMVLPRERLIGNARTLIESRLPWPV